MIGVAEAMAFGTAAVTAAVGYWFLVGLRRLPAPPPDLPDDTLPAVTILIAARNEAANAPRLARALLDQDYPTGLLRVLVVDDRSTDGTGDLLRQLGDGRINVLRIDDCPPGTSPKKHALACGLARVDTPIVLTTDADSVPPPRWARRLAAHLDLSHDLVTGLVRHLPNPSGPAWFHGLWEVEAFTYGVLGAAAVGARFPITAHAGNMGWKVQAHRRAGGWDRSIRALSGDDDFLLQAVARLDPSRVTAALEPDATVFTEGPSTWAEAWHQRVRWSSKCARYAADRVALLALLWCAYAWILGSAFLIPFRDDFWQWWIAMQAAVWIPAALVLGHAASRARWPGLWRHLPLALMVQQAVVVAATLAGTLGRFEWKGTRSTRGGGVANQ